MSDASRSVADQCARDEAIDVNRSFIVRAPAGSGKTRLLIQRYLALLATVDEPEEVIAITFTRKAAAEMRERVLNAFAAAKSDSREIDDDTVRLARAVLARDVELEWLLVSNASRLRIQTIDSMNASITRQMPLAARFGAQPESVDDARALYREAARSLLAEVNATGDLGANVGALLAHLDNNLPVAESLLADMLGARDQWLRNLSGMGEREVLEAALQRARQNAVASVAIFFPADFVNETLYLASFAGRNWPESRADAGVLALRSLQSWPAVGGDNVDAWLGVAKLLLTETGGWRKRRGLNVNCGFPPGEGKEQKADFAAIKSRMGDLLEQLETTAHGIALSVALDRLRQLPPPRYAEAQWEALGAIVRLLPSATAMLWATFSAQGKCDFTQIAQSASIALGTEEAPSDLALALDYHIRHLLVDEFQDTSVTQFELLEKLTRGWTAGDGRTLFVVGDPMQSIYRFREAEVKLFGQASRRGIGTLALTPLQLTVNFRSQPAVVAWVNQTFSALMPAAADDGSGQVPYEASVASAREGQLLDAKVKWHPQLLSPIDGEDGATDANAVEASTVVNIIRESLKLSDASATGPHDIALLVRNRSHLAGIVPALKAAGLPFRAVDIDPLKERPVVQDLLALTRALLHPADRIAWLAILRAPWCGLTLDDLAVLTRGDFPIDGALAPDPREVCELIGDEARVAMLSADGRERLIRLRSAMVPAIALCRRMPLRELIEGTWLSLQGPACLPNCDDLDDARLLLDLIEEEAAAQTGGSHVVDLGLLNARVEKLFAGNRPLHEGSVNVLQIMTIHKAKGLEFDTVIVPALHKTPRRDSRKLLVWVEQPVPETGGQELLLAPIQEIGDDHEPDSIYRYVQLQERDKQREEDIRLLYVATTRAKRQLHLLGAVDVKGGNGDAKLVPPRAGSLLASLWPVAEPVFLAAHTEQAALPVRPLPVNPIDGRDSRPAWRLSREQPWPHMLPAVSGHAARQTATPTASVDFEWAGETARHVGTVVHVFLQRIADEGLACWHRDRITGATVWFEAELRQLGVAPRELRLATGLVVAALCNALDDPRGRWVLNAHRHAKSEWRLSGVSDASIVNAVIDRTFVDDHGVRWIIDYKTGTHEGADVNAFLDSEQQRYRTQLEMYAALVQHLPSDCLPAATRLGLYFPLLKAWREWEWRST